MHDGDGFVGCSMQAYQARGTLDLTCTKHEHGTLNELGGQDYEPTR